MNFFLLRHNKDWPVASLNNNSSLPKCYANLIKMSSKPFPQKFELEPKKEKKIKRKVHFFVLNTKPEISMIISKPKNYN